MMIRIARSLPPLADREAVAVGQLVTGPQLLALTDGHLHQFGMLNLHAAPCEISWQSPGFIFDEPPAAVQGYETIFRRHPRSTQVAIVARVQVADSNGAPAGISADVYSAPDPVPGVLDGAYAWGVSMDQVFWREVDGTLMPTPGDNDVWRSTVITTGFAARAGVATGAYPRPLNLTGVGTDTWIRVRMETTYARILAFTVLELFKEAL